MNWKVYLSGEIHSNWRIEVKSLAEEAKLAIDFLEPETDHSLSDDMGAIILGKEDNKFWHDQKGAKINAIRIRKNILESDIVVVKFGEKYRQWNAAFDAGYAIGLSKSLVVLHNEDHQHALKEIDASASAVASTVDEVVKILRYTATNKI